MPDMTDSSDNKLDPFLFKALLEKAADAIYFKDTQSKYIRVSNRMVGSFNMDHPSQVEGKNDSDFFTPEHAAATRAVEEDIMRSGLPKLDMEERETWPDGEVTYASTSKFPLYDDDGKLIGLFGISRDITARKLAEERLAATQRELIEQEKKAAVSEFAGSIVANMGMSVQELRQGLDRILANTQAARTNPDALAKVKEEATELRYVAQRLSELMKLSG
jgi:PAS domain S-box-containing protein